MITALTFGGGPFKHSKRTSLNRRATSSTDVSYNVDTKFDIDMRGTADGAVNGENIPNNQSQKRKRVSRNSKSCNSIVDASAIGVSFAGDRVRRGWRRLV